MLNPGFSLIDPDSQELGRLKELSAKPDSDSILSLLSNDQLKSYQSIMSSSISQPGIYPQQRLIELLKQPLELDDERLSVMGWPVKIIQPLLSSLSQPAVSLLGILTGDGIWAGCIAGLSQGGIDFVTSYHWIWQHEPELATQQTLAGFSSYIHHLEKRVNRPGLGLFIYLDEFKQWHQAAFSPEMLDQLCQQQTAIYVWPHA